MSSQLRWGHNKYQDSSSRMSPALMRARSRYTQRNILTGAILAVFIGTSYVFAARTAGFDDFSDVPMPPVPESTVSELQRERDAKAAIAASSPLPAPAKPKS
ncbi:uncharacterized protein V1518DRAFT_445845 [Limtongia smithiae]|uniref:uncharacterized protein n=1 Tax=Limtongia smithiae TaxID=1125753 RepID=UPI0034CED2B1